MNLIVRILCCGVALCAIFFGSRFIAMSSTGATSQASPSMVNSVLSMASSKLPGLALSQFSGFTPGAVQIAGTNYPNAQTASANISLPILNVPVSAMVSVNPDLSDVAVKISGQLPSITIFSQAGFYIKACCGKDGGPELNVEVMKNNINATVFKLNGAISISKLGINSDTMITYENGFLKTQFASHRDNFDATFNVNIALPNPNNPATGVDFTVSGQIGQLVNNSLVPMVKQYLQSGLQQASGAISGERANANTKVNQKRAECNSLGNQCGWTNPGACAKKVGCETEYAGLVAYRDGILQGGSAIVSGTSGMVLQKIVEGLGEASNILDIRSIAGAWSLAKPASLPMVSIHATFTIPYLNKSFPVDVDGLQFDFQDPVGSSKSIAMGLMGAIKNGIQQSVGL